MQVFTQSCSGWHMHMHMFDDAHAWFKVSLVCNAKIIVHAKQGQTDRSSVQAFGQDELIPNCGATSDTFATCVEQKHSILHCLPVRQNILVYPL